MFIDTSPESPSHTPEDRRLLLRARLLLARAAKSGEITRGDAGLNDLALKLEILEEFAARLRTGESRAESQALSRESIKSQLMPEISALLRGLRNAKERSVEVTAPSSPSPDKTVSLESKSSAQVSFLNSLWSKAHKVLRGALLLAQIPLVIGQIVAAIVISRLSRKSSIASDRSQAPLTGASIGSQILQKFNLPQTRWVSSLIDRLARRSAGKIRLGKSSSIGNYLPNCPTLSIGDRLVPLLNWLESAEDSPGHPPPFQKAKEEIFTRILIPIKRSTFSLYSTDVEISVRVSEGITDLPLPIFHQVCSIFLHGPEDLQLHSLEAVTSIFGGMRVTVPPGVTRVTYLARPYENNTRLSPETSSLLQSFGHLDPDYDAVDREYFKLLLSSSMTAESRLALCYDNLWLTRPRIYCDNAAILQSLQTPSPYNFAYLSGIGVCLDFARQAQSDFSRSGVATVLISSSSLRNSRILYNDHIAVGVAVSGKVSLIDPTTSSYELKIPAESVALIAAELGALPRSTPEELALLADAAYTQLRRYVESKLSFDDKLGATTHYSAYLTSAVKVTWHKFVTAEPEEAPALLSSLRRHLPRIISNDEQFTFEVLAFIERGTPTNVCKALLDNLLESHKIFAGFELSPSSMCLALKIGRSTVSTLLPTEQRMALIEKILEFSCKTPNRLRLAIPVICNLIDLLPADTLSEHNLKALRKAVMVAIDLRDPAMRYLGPEVKLAYELHLKVLATHIAKSIPAIKTGLVLDLAEHRGVFCNALGAELVKQRLDPDFGLAVRRRLLQLVNVEPARAAALILSLKDYRLSCRLAPLSQKEARQVSVGFKEVLKAIPSAPPDSALDGVLQALNQPRVDTYREHLVDALVHFGLATREIAKKLTTKPWSRSRLTVLLSTLKRTASGKAYNLAAAVGYELPAAMLFYTSTSVNPIGLTTDQERAVQALKSAYKENPALLTKVISRVLKTAFGDLQPYQRVLLPHLIRISRTALPHEQYIALLATSAEKRDAANPIPGMRPLAERAFTANCTGTKFNPFSIEYQMTMVNDESLMTSVTGLPSQPARSCGHWFGLPRILIDDPTIEEASKGGFWTHCFKDSARTTFAEVFGSDRNALGAPTDPLIILSGYLGNISIQGPLSRLISSGELAALREYSPGDPIRTLDQRALARFDKLLVRHYREREAPAAVLLVDLEWLADEVPKWHIAGTAPRLFELLLRYRSLVEDGRPNRVVFQFRGRPIDIQDRTDQPYKSTGLTAKWWASKKPQFKNALLPIDDIVSASYAVSEYLHAERSIGVDKFPWNQKLAALDAGLANFPLQATIYLLNAPQNLEYTNIFVAAALRKGAKIVRWHKTR